MFFYITTVWFSSTFTVLNKIFNAHADEETIVMLGKYNVFFIIAFAFYSIDASFFALSVLCKTI